MQYRDREDKRRELFLRQFYHTAQAVFPEGATGWNSDPGRKLLSLAAPALKYPAGTHPEAVYKRLFYVWRTMHRRKRSWHGKIDLDATDLMVDW